jgi:hypothetical protein
MRQRVPRCGLRSAPPGICRWRGANRSSGSHAPETVKEFEEELARRRQDAKKRMQNPELALSSLGAFASLREIRFLSRGVAGYLPSLFSVGASSDAPASRRSLERRSQRRAPLGRCRDTPRPERGSEKRPQTGARRPRSEQAARAPRRRRSRPMPANPGSSNRAVAHA